MLNEFFLLSLLSFIIIYFSKYIAKWFKLYDEPTNRKTHKSKATYLGGICFSVYLVFLLKLYEYHPLIDDLIIVAILVSLIGFTDDIISLSPGLRLISKTILIVYLSTIGFEIKHLGSFLDTNLTLGKFGILFTIGAILSIINSYNYSDGIDGLAASLFITSMFSLSLIFYVLKIEQFTILFQLNIFLIVFLFFNFGIIVKVKTFLGNSGSYLIGFIHSYILIFFHIQNYLDPIIFAWTLAFIFYEFVSTNIIRIKNKINPLKAGKDHLHYILKNVFKKNYVVLIIINFLNLFLFFIGFVSYYFMNETSSIILFILIGFLYLFIRDKITKIYST